MQPAGVSKRQTRRSFRQNSRGTPSTVKGATLKSLPGMKRASRRVPSTGMWTRW